MEDVKKNEDTNDFLPDSTIMVDLQPGQQPAATVRASLVYLAGGDIGREIEVHGRGQIIGRSPMAHTSINAPSVSRQHVRIERVDEADAVHFDLIDLGSSNGTHVNGDRIDRVRLKNGDRIALGEVLFKFILQDEVDQRFHQEIHRLITYDRLTGLMTMESFRQHLDRQIQLSGSDSCFSLAMTDLDGLKKVNDTHGHLAGRMVVREMGAMMRACMRSNDIPALYGGDEGVILFPGTPLAGAVEVAEKLRLAIQARVFAFEDKEFKVSISQGLAEWPRHGRTAREIIAAADRALYAAKAAGRNCVKTAGA